MIAIKRWLVIEKLRVQCSDKLRVFPNRRIASYCNEKNPRTPAKIKGGSAGAKPCFQILESNRRINAIWKE